MDRSALVRELCHLLGEAKVLSQYTDLLCYSYDASFLSQLQPRLPDAVVLPNSTAEVAQVVAFAYERGIPITPRGAATGQTGGAVPVRGGIVVALNRLDRIIELDAANLQAIVQPGLVHADLNAFLARHSLVFPPDPGSSRMCTVGGMAANNAHGMRALKYGATADWVLGLEVVLPTGQVITTGSVGSRAIQSSSGLELTKLFVGSEGTLGIITQLRLKLMPKPEARAVVLAAFDRLENAGEATIQTFRAGILPSAIEILDASSIKAVNLYRPGTGLPEAEALLLFEAEGNPPGAAYDAQRIAQIVAPLAQRVEWADEPGKVATLWEARSAVGAAVGVLRPQGMRVYAGEDICVPISQVPQTLRAIQDLAKKYDIVVATYGHIGVGNLHAGPIIDPTDPDEVRRVLLLADEVHQLALQMGGTTTGEHGVGLSRAQYMPAEHGAALNTMWQVKQALDPKGIMNPGKLFPEGYPNP